jgi:cation diffusion facilitator family transporter
MELSNKRWILISFLVSIVLMALKFFAFYLTNSNAILTDAVESIVNVVASGFALYSIYLSAVPKDKNHPYGHGKIEFFSAGVEGTLIILASIFILIQSVRGIISPGELQHLPEGMLIIGFSTLVNLVIGYFLVKNGKRTASIALIADGKHLTSDGLSSLVLVLGVGVVLFTGISIIDSFLALAFSIYIFINGLSLVRKSVVALMDGLDPETLARVSEILSTHRREDWIDIHNLRVQRYGADIHVDCHITLPFYYNLVQSHEAIDVLEHQLKKDFKFGTEIFIHADPCIPENCCHYCRVSNCHERIKKFDTSIEWTPELLMKNQKHFKS